ncbi:MAG: DUF6272 family protein [Flavobacteriales bacterium]
MKWPAQAVPKDGQIEFSFHGKMDVQTSELIIDQMERKMAHSQVEKRVMRVVIEMVQNLHHHADPNRAQESRFLCIKRPTSWLVSTANAIQPEKAKDLKTRIERLANLDSDALRTIRREHLYNCSRTPHGGGGVGLLEIHHKSAGEVWLEFIPSTRDSQLSVLTAEIHDNHE